MKTYRLILIALAATLMAACHINLNGDTKWTYENPELYKLGDATLEQTINDIDVSWLEGNIDIVYADHPEVRIYEVSDSALNDSLRMHWYVDDEGCLKIQFCKSGTYKTLQLNNLGKHLTIALPRGMKLDELDVDAVSTDLCIDSVCCRELNLDAVNVTTTVLAPTLPDEIDVDAVNTTFRLYVPPSAGMTIEMNGVSTELNCELPVGKDGKKTIIGDGRCKVDIDAVKCSVYINDIGKQ